MSEVRVCENCEQRAYASEAHAALRRTVEVERDGTIHAADWTICPSCADKLNDGDTCPYCLESLRDGAMDPANCPEKPEGSA